MDIAKKATAAPCPRTTGALPIPPLPTGALLLVAVVGLLGWGVAASIAGNAELSLTAHIFIETIYVAVAVAVSSVAWHTPGDTHRLRNTLAACLFLLVAVFDLMHFLSTPGMPGPLAETGTTASFYFGRLYRALLPIALLVLTLVPRSAAITGRMRLGLLVATLVAMAAAVSQGFNLSLADDALPNVFALLRATMIGLFLLVAVIAGRIGDLDATDARYLVHAALLGALAEGCLILGQGGAGVSNGLFAVLGHLYGILMLVAIFIGVYGGVVRHPYAELQEAHALARIASERREAILTAIGDGIIGLDERLRIQFANPVARRFVALPDSRTDAMTLRDAFAALDGNGAPIVTDVEACLRDGKTSDGIFDMRMTNEGANDTPRSVEYAVTPVRDADLRIIGALLVLHDVTANRQLQNQLLAAADYARNLFEACPDPLIAIGADGVVSDANRAAELMSGQERCRFVGTRFMSSFTDAAGARDALRQALDGHTLRDVPLTFAREGGGLLQVNCSIAPHRDGERIRGAFAIVRDVTDLHQTQIQLQFQADYDALTALPNRRQFRERIAQAIARTERDGDPVAVMVVDLDDFKDINDTLGTEQGDDLLKIVAARLADTLRENDILARIGGDEFGLLVSGAALAREIQPLTERILAIVGAPLSLGDRELTISCSIGVSIHPLDAGDADTLLGNADTAMHGAKENGKNGCQYFTAEMNETLRRRVDLAFHLRSALALGEFAVHYQPQVNLRDDSVGGVEALLRWKNPQLGFVSPAEFIPVAEDTGLILPIGAWVLEEACRQAVRWRDENGVELRVAVNLSARQFRDPDLVAMVRDVLAATGLPSRLLELELTESMLMRDATRAAETMEQLKATGAGLSIDDFGTGYSSLAYLKRFPLDKLKIDRSFVMDVPGDPNDIAIIRSILGLAHGLGLKVVAEGAETDAQMDFLRAGGCDVVQGYFVSRPLPAADLPAFVARWHEKTMVGADATANR